MPVLGKSFRDGSEAVAKHSTIAATPLSCRLRRRFSTRTSPDLVLILTYLICYRYLPDVAEDHVSLSIVFYSRAPRKSRPSQRIPKVTSHLPGCRAGLGTRMARRTDDGCGGMMESF
ncbi:hypothetical protein P691DRAFT_598363 [Macrolepiota fuliginosa MF-IS2]|uniref:Uncharacterized protein n=1 Tax=Macrolepiota fuliginosa MF-IS2 TaxID=1400762 RepID=A0A9P5XD45_9AGAR|nr:hypothetical protein P691DRAFT_598363 [Macrolepiota fuliginosa MF-IS2]